MRTSNMNNCIAEPPGFSLASHRTCSCQIYRLLSFSGRIKGCVIEQDLFEVCTRWALGGCRSRRFSLFTDRRFWTCGFKVCRFVPVSYIKFQQHIILHRGKSFFLQCRLNKSINQLSYIATIFKKNEILGRIEQ